MAARPPGSDDETEVVAFGIPVVEAHLADADLAFPATRDEVLDAVGNPEIPYDAGSGTVSLATALEHTGTESFDTRRDLLNALHPVFEDLRTTRASGVLGRVRRALPF